MEEAKIDSITLSVEFEETPAPKQYRSTHKMPLRVLFLSMDTGGGHRASAQALGKQFQILFPGSTYDLLDVWSDIYPSSQKRYQHLSTHPRQWRVLYHLSNSRTARKAMELQCRLSVIDSLCEKMRGYDVVVSVHPLMNLAPKLAAEKLEIPFATVVTDLGSAHKTWFQSEMVFVASPALEKQAKAMGVKEVFRIGLPIRSDFTTHFDLMGDRTLTRGKAYRRQVQERLLLQAGVPVVLCMGGGDGVGSLCKSVEGIYTELRRAGISATLCVVSGHNENLRRTLDRDWDEYYQKSCRPRRVIWNGCRSIDGVDEGIVTVQSLGFVKNIADYMVAADLLVTKAGPGTIAEAAALGLPVILTSFLPGQEAGNVEFVVESGFGDFSPRHTASLVSEWLQTPGLLDLMSQNAHRTGCPDAAAEIAVEIAAATHFASTVKLCGR